MASRMLQGDGYPQLIRYNSSNVAQATVDMPYVRDDGNSSYVRQYFEPYPDKEILHHSLLSGAVNEDKPVGHKFRCIIKYSSIKASTLLSIFNLILDSLENAGNYLTLIPRDDNALAAYKVVYKGIINLESSNMWEHDVTLEFHGTELVATTLALSTP